MPSRRRRFRYRPKPVVKRPPANEEIKAPELRLIGAAGEQLGVVATSAARQQAAEAGLDLVIVAEKAQPPVARLLDLGKHLYEKRKKDAKQKAKSRGGEIKGVRIGFKTDTHDWEIRLRQAAGFLAEGNKVKLEMRLKGRERYRGDFARQKMLRFVTEVPSGAKMEDHISQSYHGLSATLTKNSTGNNVRNHEAEDQTSGS